MKKIILSFFILIVVNGLCQTTISPQLICSAGGSGVVGTTYYDYSVGEPITLFGGTSCDSIFSGFQHCAIDTLTIVKNNMALGGPATFCSNSSVILTAPNGASWLWSPGGMTTQTVSINTSGNYKVRTTNSCGDTINSNYVLINVLTPPTPSICMVTADSLVVNDSTRYNIIMWDKTAYNNVDSFIIHREVSTNIYARIGAVVYDSLSLFRDTTRSVGPANGNPNVGTYRYKLQARDTCGVLGPLSPYHNSIHVNNSSGTFTWNLYDVQGQTTPVTNFHLMRDNANNGFWTLVGSVTGTQNTLIDGSYATYVNVANWRVDADGFVCTPTARYGNNNVQGAIVKSRSNVKNNRTTGNSQLAGGDLQVAVYPQPASGIVAVDLGSNQTKITLELYNAIGDLVLTENAQNTASVNLNIQSLAAGVYTLVVGTEKGKVVKKLVKE